MAKSRPSKVPASLLAEFFAHPKETYSAPEAAEFLGMTVAELMAEVLARYNEAPDAEEGVHRSRIAWIGFDAPRWSTDLVEESFTLANVPASDRAALLQPIAVPVRLARGMVTALDEMASARGLDRDRMIGQILRAGFDRLGTAGWSPDLRDALDVFE